MGSFGPHTLGTGGRGITVAIDPSRCRWKAGGLTIDWSKVARGANEQVTITIDATGGTFTVTYAGQTTAATAYNASADTLETNLEALSTIGNGNVKVSKTGSVFTIEGINDLAKTNLTAFTTNAGSLTGGASTATVAVPQQGATDQEVTLADGTVIPAGEKYILPGTVLSRITASDKYAPADTSASDGRETVDSTKRGRCFLLNRLLRQSEMNSDHIGDIFDAGQVYRARLQVDGTYQPTTANLLAMMPGITPVDA